MALFQTLLFAAAFLCSLVAGFLFAFAVVVMPGIRPLSDRAYLRAFQAMDRIIQQNQPLFLIVWVGSILAVVLAAAFGLVHLEGGPLVLLIAAALAYLLGVQLPTVTINIPLNNTIQALDVQALDDAAARAARAAFEPRWTRWNAIRTTVSSLVSALLLALLFWL
ncbi:MAG: anthrone oxygenase family protein [Rhodothermales bacterium]|nr:anthrone oxygenase family protein [Rhodothermales bacterium]